MFWPASEPRSLLRHRYPMRGLPVLAAGEKGDGLVHLHPLALQDFKQSSPGLGIVARDQPKTGCGSFSRRTFADNHFKRAIFAALRRARVNIAAIKADRQRGSRFRQLVLLRWAPLDKGRLLVA